MAVDVGSAVGYLDLDISGFLANLKSAQSEADKQSKNIATTIGGNLSNIGKGMTSVGTSLTKNVTVPLAGVGFAGLKVATDFEKGMSEVKAISGATGKEFDALKDKAIELGADTAFSANEVAAAMTEMAKAGWSSQQIIDGMGGVLSAAAASGEGLASVSTIVADTITGFGMAASDSTKVADLLTQAANSGTIGIADLGESFKYIAPVAGSMGMSVEDVTTAISAMSMAGIKGSQAGTALRTMLTNLVNPSDDAAGVMAELGISATNADGSMKSLDEIVANLRTSFAGLTEAERSQAAAILAGKTGMSGMLALLNLTEEEYNSIAKSMDNSSGVAEKTASVMQDNLQSKVEQLGGALESLAIKLAEYVLPYLQQFVLWLTNLIDKFAALDPETQKTILKFAAIAAAAGPVLLVLGKLVSGVGGFITMLGKIPGTVSGIKTGFTTLTTGLKNVGEGFKLAKAGYGGLATSAGGAGTKIGAAMAGISASALAVVAVIAILVAAFVSLWKNNEEFRNKITAIWDQVKASFEKLTSGIVERLNKLGFDFENITEVLSAIWKGFCDLLAPYFEGVFSYIANYFDTIVNVILGVFDFFIAIFTGDWQGAWDAIKGIFESIWNGIVNWFKIILGVFTGMFDVVLGWFGTSWTECWTAIKDFFVNTWNGIATFFTNLWNGLTTFLQSAWDTIKNIVQVSIMFIAELFTAAFEILTIPFRFIWENCKDTIISVWEVIKTTVSTVLDAIAGFFVNTWNGIKAFLEPILTAIANFFTNIWNGIKIAAETVWNGIATFFTNTWNGIKNIATTIWNGIKDVMTAPINAAKAAISGAVDSIKNIFTSGFNAVKNTVTSIFDGIKNGITGALDAAKTGVSNAINKIKGFFNFSWSLPKLKMPHPKISGSFSLNPPSVPKFSIEWYKKAMNGGMILNGATIFGMDNKGNFLGGGEAGSETIVGTTSLLNMIKQAVHDAIEPLISASVQLANASAELGYVTYNGFAKLKESKGKQDNPGRNEGGSGDTFNFYSPKAIDEIEAAKQMKKAKRDLAEGF